MFMFISFFFFFSVVRELHLGLHHITHSTHGQRRVPAKGELLQWCQRKGEKWKKKRLNMGWVTRVQFQSNSISNTAHHFSITCVGLSEFFRHTEGMWNSDGDGKMDARSGVKDSSPRHQLRVVNGSHRSALITLTCMFEHGPSCHCRAWMEYQFEPIFGW